MIKLLLQGCGSIHDEQQNIIFTIHAKANFSAYTYTLRDGANPSSRKRLHTKAKMANCILGDQVRKQNSLTFHMCIPFW